MKRPVSVILCCALLSSLVLCGCNKTKETTVSSEPEETAALVSDTEESEEPFDLFSRKIDEEKLGQVSELYDSKQPEGDHVVSIYSDGIRGSGFYYFFENDFVFGYDSLHGSLLTVNVDAESEMATVNFMLEYENSCLYGVSQKTGITEIESVIDDLISGNTEMFDLFQKSALEVNGEEIKADFPVIYSRLITLADKAFPELGFGIEDLGIDLGDKYRPVDPVQTASNEIVIVNEHKFENGVCSDCGMLWTEYFYDAIEEEYGIPEDEWHSANGQKSPAMLSEWDYVMFTASDEYNGQIYYHHMDEKDNIESLTIELYDDMETVKITFRFEQGMYSVGDGIVGYNYIYDVSIEAAPEDLDEIFKSRDSFKDYCEMHFIIMEDGIGYDAWYDSDYDDDEIAEEVEGDGCRYYTGDEIIDMFWGHRENFFESMDNAMVWLDTSLKDIGFNWKRG